MIHPEYEEMISVKLCVGYLSVRFGVAGAGRIWAETFSALFQFSVLGASAVGGQSNKAGAKKQGRGGNRNGGWGLAHDLGAIPGKLNPILNMVVAGGKPAKISAKYINGDLPLQGFSAICSLVIDGSKHKFHFRAIPDMVVTLIKAAHIRGVMTVEGTVDCKGRVCGRDIGVPAADATSHGININAVDSGVAGSSERGVNQIQTEIIVCAIGGAPGFGNIPTVLKSRVSATETME